MIRGVYGRQRAIKEKVAFVPGQAFFMDECGANTMRLNFSNADEPMIEEGMTRLARVFAHKRNRPTARVVALILEPFRRRGPFSSRRARE